MLWTKLMFEPFKEIWENRDCYRYNIRDENAPWYKQVWQTIVHSFGDLTPISVSSAQRAVDTGGTWSKDAVLAVLGFGPAPSYAERSTIQNRISFLKVVKVRSFKRVASRRTGDCWLLHSHQENHHSGRGRPGTALTSGPLRRKTRLEERRTG